MTSAMTKAMLLAVLGLCAFSLQGCGKDEEVVEDNSASYATAAAGAGDGAAAKDMQTNGGCPAFLSGIDLAKDDFLAEVVPAITGSLACSSSHPTLGTSWVTGDYQEDGGKGDLPPPGTPCVGGCVASSGRWGVNYCWTSSAQAGNAWGAPCVQQGTGTNFTSAINASTYLPESVLIFTSAKCKTVIVQKLADAALYFAEKDPGFTAWTKTPGEKAVWTKESKGEVETELLKAFEGPTAALQRFVAIKISEGLEMGSEELTDYLTTNVWKETQASLGVFCPAPVEAVAAAEAADAGSVAAQKAVEAVEAVEKVEKAKEEAAADGIDPTGESTTTGDDVTPAAPPMDAQTKMILQCMAACPVIAQASGKEAACKVLEPILACAEINAAACKGYMDMMNGSAQAAGFTDMKAACAMMALGAPSTPLPQVQQLIIIPVRDPNGELREVEMVPIQTPALDPNGAPELDPNGEPQMVTKYQDKDGGLWVKDDNGDMVPCDHYYVERYCQRLPG